MTKYLFIGGPRDGERHAQKEPAPPCLFCPVYTEPTDPKAVIECRHVKYRRIEIKIDLFTFTFYAESGLSRAAIMRLLVEHYHPTIQENGQ